MGRRIVKTFENRDDFEGIVYVVVDDDDQNKDYRLFWIHYFEDSDDAESMWSKKFVK